MEVYSLSGLTYTIPPATNGIIEFSGNSIPIQFTKGTGQIFSPDVLTLNSDNISSGRRKLGMLVYVYETKKIYQYTIDNYDTLWNNATGATGSGGSTVVISDYGTTVKNNSSAGIAFISAWTSSTISGIGGYNDTNASWRVLQTGSNSGGTFTGGTVSGATIFTNGLTANTISATTYYNLSSNFQYEIHVSQVDGNDTTGNGTLLNPVKTIVHALTLVGSQRKTIIIHPGTYTENPNITVQYTVLTSFELLGGNTVISGTVSTSSGCTISGLKMTNLNISASTGTGNVNVLNCDISGTLTKSNTGDYTLIRFCDIGTTNITSSGGLVAIFGGNPNFITINNVFARVIVKNAVTVAPVLTAGNANFVDSILLSTGSTSNAITTSVGTIVTLANSQIIVPSFSGVARVSLSGLYSIFNCVYDKPNSTLVSPSGPTLTSGSTNSIDYFQYINADKFITQGGTSSKYVMGDGSLSNGFTGGTVSGATRFTSGLTANTISATTISATNYIGLPADIYVTSGNIDHDANLITLNRSSGSTVQITNLVTVIEKSRYDIWNSLIPSNSLVKGVTYKVTNCDSSLYDNRNGHTFTTVYLNAIENDVLSDTGIGVFYTPKYINGNNWEIWSPLSILQVTSISGEFQPDEPITGNNGATGIIFGDITSELFYIVSGDWSGESTITGDVSGATATISSLTIKEYNSGDVVFWGGTAWFVTDKFTSVAAVATDIFNLDSATYPIIQKLPLSDDNIQYYNISYDEVIYDIANDRITYRKDKNNNIVSTTTDNITLWENIGKYNPIKAFKWGHDFTHSNETGIGNQKIVNSYNENINFRGTAQYNIEMDNLSYQTNIYGEGVDTFQSDLYLSSSYQNNIKIVNTSRQVDIKLENSYQNNLNLLIGSNQRRVNFENQSYQSDITITTASNQEDIIFENKAAQYNAKIISSNQRRVKFYNFGFNRGFTNVNENDKIYTNTLRTDNSALQVIGIKNNELVEVDVSSIGGTSTFTGGTVSGATRFTGGLTANTISATTYQNLNAATGGTYSNGIIALSGTGQLGVITGLTTPFTGGTVSGATRFTGGLSANTISATTYLNLPSSTFTGGTVSGATNFTGGLSSNTISATTFTSNTETIIGGIPTSSTSIVSTGSNPQSVYVQGRYLYVVNGTSYSLQIFDVSNPLSPVSVGTVSIGPGSNPQSVYVQGRYAYVTNNSSNTLQIFDVSNSSSPVSVGVVPTGSAPFDVYVQGRYAYVVNSTSNTLQIFDVSNPLSPVSVGTVPTGSSPFDVYVQGRYAYVVNYGSSTLQIFDVSNPSSPVSVGTVPTGSAPYGVYVQGRYVYVINYSSNTLQIFDVSNPLSPVSVGTVSTNTNPRSVYVQGRYAYVVNYNTNTLQIFDVSNSSSPVSVGTVSTSLRPQSVYVQGRYVYVVNGSGSSTLQIFDVGGSYIQQLEAGGILTSTLESVGNATIGNDLAVVGGLNVSQSANILGNLSSTNMRVVSGLTATTISATTYQNLPTDVRVTGGTYSNGTAIFTNNTGGTFNVTGLTTPFTGGTVNGLTATTISATTYLNYPDTFVTGFTLTSNTVTLTQNRTDGYSSFTISLSAYTGSSSTSGAFLPLSGGTVTGGTIFTSGVTANTISATTYQNLPATPFLPLSGGTVSGATIFTNGLTANTISATTYQNLPTDIRVTGGTYTSGNVIFTNNTGGTFTVSGFTVGGGGGQTFYLNLSQSQGGNRLLSTTGSTASEQTSGVTISNGVTSTIASFQSQPLNITLLPGGVWGFYLHSYKQNSNASFDIFVELYKRTSGGTQTLLFTTDPAPVTTNSPNPSMQLSDGYFSGTPLSVSDSIVAVVRATNTGNQSHTITLVTEGSQHYSYVVSTIPTQQGLTCDTLSGCGIIQTIQTDVSNKLDKSGGTITGNLVINSGLTATTISATTYQNLPSTPFLPLSGGTVTGNTIFTSGLTANTVSATTISATTYNGYEPADMRTDLTNRRLGYTVSTDFLSTFTAALAPFSFGAVASGTFAVVSSQIDSQHPGVQQMLSFTGVTNSGGYVTSHAATNAFSTVFTDGLQTDLIFKLPATTTNNYIRFGHQYGSVAITAPTSGNYFEITGTTLVGITRSSSVQSATSSFTLTASTWYHARVKESVVGATTGVTFTVYDMSGVTLYNQSLTTNINLVTTRGVTVFGVNTVSQASVTAIIYLDYLGVTFPPMIRGALD